LTHIHVVKTLTHNGILFIGS